ncbi:MAG: hypothetical protein ACXVC0_22050, partial [Bdellovibrionota bacterium]
SVIPAAASAQPIETRIEGAAATEMYDKLNIAETDVRDEHGGAAFGKAKYGTSIGCEKLNDQAASCWFISGK